MVIGKKGYRKEKTQLWIWAKSFINFAPLPKFEPVTSRINRKVSCLNNYVKQQLISKKDHCVIIRVIKSKVALCNSWALRSIFYSLQMKASNAKTIQ